MTDELARERRAELLRQGAEARLARQVSRRVARRGSGRVRLRAWMAAALHRTADRVEPASLPVRHREPC